jgi:hypothetical protein
MPNYDEVSHDMSFTLGGETFVVHDVSADILEKWEVEEAEAIEAVASGEADKNGHKETTMQRIDRHILLFMEGDAESAKRYRALRARKGKDAVPAWKFVAFHNDLYETQSGRPTKSPSPSAPGRGATAVSSGAA